MRIFRQLIPMVFSSPPPEATLSGSEPPGRPTQVRRMSAAVEAPPIPALRGKLLSIFNEAHLEGCSEALRTIDKRQTLVRARAASIICG